MQMPPPRQLVVQGCMGSLLKKSIQKGEVFLVTNAAYGWVEYTDTKFYPNTLKLLKQIKVLSAKVHPLFYNF